MRESILAGGVLRCDVARCASPPFVTYSHVALTRAQAKRAGWRRVSGKRLSGGDPGLILSDKKVDICPTCTPAPYEKPPKVPKEPKAKTKRKRKQDGEPIQATTAPPA